MREYRCRFAAVSTRGAVPGPPGAGAGHRCSTATTTSSYTFGELLRKLAGRRVIRSRQPLVRRRVQPRPGPRPRRPALRRAETSVSLEPAPLRELRPLRQRRAGTRRPARRVSVQQRPVRGPHGTRLARIVRGDPAPRLRRSRRSRRPARARQRRGPRGLGHAERHRGAVRRRETTSGRAGGAAGRGDAAARGGHGPGRQRLTYAQLVESVERLATRLARHGASARRTGRPQPRALADDAGRGLLARPAHRAAPTCRSTRPSRTIASISWPRMRTCGRADPGLAARPAGSGGTADVCASRIPAPSMARISRSRRARRAATTSPT